MQNFLKRLANWIFYYHKGIVLFSLIITILSALLVFRITIKTDMLDVFPTKNPFIKTFVDFLNDFGSIDNLIIVLESDAFSVDSHIEFAELLAEKLKVAPFVKDIDYNIFHTKGDIFFKNFPLYIDNQLGFDSLKKKLTKTGIYDQIKRNRHTLISPFSSVLQEELIAKDPLNIRSIFKNQFAQKGFGEGIFKEGYYISKDNSTLLMFVKPTGKSRDIMFITTLKEKLEKILYTTLKSYGNPEDLRIGLTGPYAFAAEAQATIYEDIIYSFLSSAILVILLFQFVYKIRFMVLLITMATLFTAISWTLGLAYLLFGGLNLITSIIAAMLMGLGIDYIIHIFKRFEREIVEKGDPLKALEITLTKTGIGVITGAVTTALAFFSIVVTSFKGLHQLGIVAGIGVLSCLLVTVVVMTSLLLWVEMAMPHHLFQQNDKGMGTIGIATQVISRSKLFVFIGAILFIISIPGISKVRFDTSPEKMGLKESSALVVENRVAKKFGKQKNPLILLSKKSTEEELFASFGAMEQKLEEWQKENVIDSYTSLNLLIPSPLKQAVAIKRLQKIRKYPEIDIDNLEKNFLAALAENNFTPDEYYKQYIRGIQKNLRIDKPVGLDEFNQGNHKKVEHFYNKSKYEIAAYIFPKNGQWQESVLEKLKQDIAAVEKNWILLGANLIFKELKGSIIIESFFSAVITFVVVFGMLYLQFRSIKKVFLVLLPLSLGFIYTIGLMGITGIRFNYFNVGAIGLIFGIGVDYGIYILHGYLERGTSDVEKTVQEVGKSVVMCAITTIIGFGSLMTMRFNGVASLGLVISIGVIFCLFTAIVLLPALLHFLKD